MGFFNRGEKQAPVDYHAYDTVTFKVVGTTFKNKDGEPRQEVLQYLYEHRPGFLNKTWPIVSFEPYKYKGRPALAVYALGSQVGNIAEAEVDAVSRLLPQVASAELVIDFFEKSPNSGKIIYTAETVLYIRPGAFANSGRTVAPQAKLTSKASYIVEELKVVGYTSQNPDGEFIQDVLGRLKGSKKMTITFGEHPKGKHGTTYIFVNGMIIGSFY